MPRSAASALLHTVLIAGGAAVGFCHAFRSAEPHRDEQLPALGEVPERRALEPVPGLPTLAPGLITESQFNDRLAQVSCELRLEMDARFGSQEEAIHSLREMTGHTSELIERLLDRLDADRDSGSSAPLSSLHP